MSFGHSKKTGIMSASDGKRFCYMCRKLMRIGQQYKLHSSPKPFKREIGYYYKHKTCLNNPYPQLKSN